MRWQIGRDDGVLIHVRPLHCYLKSDSLKTPFGDRSWPPLTSSLLRRPSWHVSWNSSSCRALCLRVFRWTTHFLQIHRDNSTSGVLCIPFAVWRDAQVLCWRPGRSTGSRSCWASTAVRGLRTLLLWTDRQSSRLLSLLRGRALDVGRW
jgi:hypothetical protein